MLQQIKSLGIRLAIDDFGTGYSSLSYLHRFPLDTLKIDRSFISVMEEDGEGMEIARSMVPMANNLRLDVVAEGVETIQQVALLKKLQMQIWPGILLFQTTVRRGDRDIVWQETLRGKRASKPGSSAEVGTGRTGTESAAPPSRKIQVDELHNVLSQVFDRSTLMKLAGQTSFTIEPASR